MKSATGYAFALLAGLVSAAPAPQAAYSSDGAAAAIYAPPAGTTWQISLSEPIDATQALVPDVSVYDVDLYDTPDASFTAFKAKGKKVICYFSAGSYEPNRPDSSDFQSADLGSVMDGWPDEKWLNVKTANVRSIMSKRIALAKQKGCDGIDPDNVDGWTNSNGVGLTQADAVDFINYLAGVASSNGMAMGLKNAGDIVTSVLPNIQYAVVEQCHEYSECDLYQPFIKAGKPVFSIEYPAESGNKIRRRRAAPKPVAVEKRQNTLVAAAASAIVSKFCASSSTDSAGFSVVIKKLSLDQSLQTCPAVAIVGGDGGSVPTPSAPSTTAPAATQAPASTPSASSSSDDTPSPAPTATAPSTGSASGSNSSSDGTGSGSDSAASFSGWMVWGSVRPWGSRGGRAHTHRRYRVSTTAGGRKHGN